MSLTAREGFLQRVRALEAAVNSPSALLLLQHRPSKPTEDEMSRLLRNGLAVSSFAILEDFLRTRTSELLRRVSGSTLRFNELPAALQALCTSEVTTALRFQVELRKRNGEDITPLVREAGRALASVSRKRYELSDLAFGRSRSNIGHRDVKEVMRAFNIPDGWGNITSFARRMGFAPLSLVEDFQGATTRRHLGAHVAGSETALGDLQGFPAQAIGIAAAFDALMSRASYRLVTADKAFASAKPSLTHDMISIRFIESDGIWFREIAVGNTRATRRAKTLSPIRKSARAHAEPTGGVIVLRRNGVPYSWETTDLRSRRS
jgi:hypothetical protein